MNPDAKAALTAEIKSYWILQYESWYIKTLKRRNNKTAFFLVLFGLMLLLFLSIYFFIPFLSFGFFMCYTSIASGIKERAWARKYNLLLPEVQDLIRQTFP